MSRRRPLLRLLLLLAAPAFSTSRVQPRSCHPALSRRTCGFACRALTSIRRPGCAEDWCRASATRLWGYRASDSSRQPDEVIDISGDGGVTKRILRPGYGYQQGPPPKYAYVKVSFVMKTADGTLIADRMDQPLEFLYGLDEPEVIPGWELAIRTMQNNEIAEVTCASGYAFGAEGYKDRIPPDATIVSRLRMISWRSVKDSASTTITDTEELSRKWREELDEGFSPMNVWANPRAAQAEARAKKEEGGKVEEQAEAPPYQPSTLNDQPPPPTPRPQPSSSAAPPGAQQQEEVLRPPFEEMEESNGLRRVDLDDLTRRKKLNPRQVVIGKAPQYRWREKQEYLDLVLPVPEHVTKTDVLCRLSPRKLLLGYKDSNGEEVWVIGGDLYGPIEMDGSFWVLGKGFADDLNEGNNCIELHLEKKEPLKRIWAKVFVEDEDDE